MGSSRAYPLSLEDMGHTGKVICTIAEECLGIVGLETDVVEDGDGLGEGGRAGRDRVWARGRGGSIGKDRVTGPGHEGTEEN